MFQHVIPRNYYRSLLVAILVLMHISVSESYSSSIFNRHDKEPVQGDADHPPTLTPVILPSLAPSQFPTDNPSVAPTDIPTSIPTEAPSATPTNTPPTTNPTLIPSQIPTEAPTRNPTDSPTNNPTVAPTVNPTGVPSSSPIDNPNNPTGSSTGSNPTGSSTGSNPTGTVTINPTVSPTNNPTGAPTSNPTVAATTDPPAAATSNPTVTPTIITTQSPTDQPSSTKCSISGTGSFGESSSNSIVVSYVYQMTKVENVPSAQILPDLEGAISNSMLSSFFTVCSSSIQERRRLESNVDVSIQISLASTEGRYRRNRRTQSNGEVGVEVVGLTSSPDDLPSEDNCEGPVTFGTDCEIIEGRMTLFYKEETTDLLRRQKRYLQDETSTSSTDTSAVITLAQSTIQSNMNGGEYISAHAAIVELAYIGDSRQDISVGEEVIGAITTDTDTETLGGNAFPIYGWVLVGAGSFLIASGFYVQRYMATRKANYDDDDEDEEDYDEIETGS